MKKTATTGQPVGQSTIARDLYQEVTAKIIALLEQGVAPWRRTWNIYGLARNYVTGHIYTGINMILMNNTKHPIPYFLTFDQVKEKGGRIRKGAKAEMIIYFKLYYKDALGQKLSQDEAHRRAISGETIEILKFIKYYNVFNIADVEGVEFKLVKAKLKVNEKIAKCESIVEQMPYRPELMHIDHDTPFYSPVNDFVNMPSIKQFESAQAYYATFFHELVHSTGHTSRLGREEVMNPEKFGSKKYSQEELLAEMGASFLCSTVNIDYDAITENSAAYLANWLKVLREDSKFIFKAAAEAQKAVDYILGEPQE